MLIKVTRCCFELEEEDGLAEDGVSQLREMGYTHGMLQWRASTHLSQPEKTK